MAVLKSSLGRIAADMEKYASEALLQTAVDIYEVSQQLVPVDTGALKQSGGVEPLSSSKVVIGYGDEVNVNYAKHVEYGTSHSASQPFLTPAFVQAEETFKVRIAEAVEKDVAVSVR